MSEHSTYVYSTRSKQSNCNNGTSSIKCYKTTESVVKFLACPKLIGSCSAKQIHAVRAAAVAAAATASSADANASNADPYDRVLLHKWWLRCSVAFLLLLPHYSTYICRQDVDARRACCETLTRRQFEQRAASSNDPRCSIRVPSSSRSRARYCGRRVVRWKIAFKESGRTEQRYTATSSSNGTANVWRPLAMCNGRTNECKQSARIAPKTKQKQQTIGIYGNFQLSNVKERNTPWMRFIVGVVCVDRTLRIAYIQFDVWTNCRSLHLNLPFFAIAAWKKRWMEMERNVWLCVVGARDRVREHMSPRRFSVGGIDGKTFMSLARVWLIGFTPLQCPICFDGCVRTY